MDMTIVTNDVKGKEVEVYMIPSTPRIQNRAREICITLTLSCS